VTAYRFIPANRDRYTVRETAGLFGVSSGAYYRWAKHGMSDRRCRRDGELVRLIREIQEQHHFRYGSPRVRKALRAGYGKQVSRKKAAGLMRVHGLHARKRRTFIRTTDFRSVKTSFSGSFRLNGPDRNGRRTLRTYAPPAAGCT
jgi:hypothetical protein